MNLLSLLASPDGHLAWATLPPRVLPCGWGSLRLLSHRCQAGLWRKSPSPLLRGTVTKAPCPYAKVRSEPGPGNKEEAPRLRNACVLGQMRKPHISISRAGQKRWIFCICRFDFPRVLLLFPPVLVRWCHSEPGPGLILSTSLRQSPSPKRLRAWGRQQPCRTQGHTHRVLSLLSAATRGRHIPQPPAVLQLSIQTGLWSGWVDALGLVSTLKGTPLLLPGSPSGAGEPSDAIWASWWASCRNSPFCLGSKAGSGVEGGPKH